MRLPGGLLKKSGFESGQTLVVPQLLETQTGFNPEVPHF
jgi:hypothetical protein